MPNLVQTVINDEGLDRRAAFVALNVDDDLLDFPILTLEDLRFLTRGVFQIKKAPAYAKEHLDEDGNFAVQMSRYDRNDNSRLIRAQIPYHLVLFIC